MTHTIFRKGYDLLMIPYAKTYHLNSHESSGDGKWDDLINENEKIFIEKMKMWGIIPDKIEIIEKNGDFFVKKNKDLFSVTK